MSQQTSTRVTTDKINFVQSQIGSRSPTVFFLILVVSYLLIFGLKQEEIGGIFFDDWNEGSFEEGLGLMRSVGEAYLSTYPLILERRKDTEFTARERTWQLMRRGRYVEFNLLQDRGTLFGLQAGGRVECILASMPPEVHWRYDHKPAPGSPEEALMVDFLPPKDWLAGNS